MKPYKSWLREHFESLSEEEKQKYYPEIIAQLDESRTYQRHTILVILLFTVIYPPLVCYLIMLKE